MHSEAFFVYTNLLASSDLFESMSNCRIVLKQHVVLVQVCSGVVCTVATLAAIRDAQQKICIRAVVMWPQMLVRIILGVNRSCPGHGGVEA